MTIEAVKRKYEHEWLALPGVVSVGIGLNDAGRGVIKVGVAEGECPKPSIPEKVHGYEVVMVYVGQTKAFRGR